MEVLFILFLVNSARGAISGTYSVKNILDHSKSGVKYKYINNSVIKKLALMETPDFIKYFGYPCETHEVITEDGYVLNMHHVPHGKNGTIEEIQPVVFLQHGLFSFSGDWFTSGPERSLGFILADAGYDVWVGNARGNKYSRNHLNLNPDLNSTFWDFSFHEIGYYDLPAMIDYVLTYTQQDKMFYVGHSQGTTSYYVLLSEKPNYNEKFIAQYSLAPEAFMSHMYGPGLKFLTSIETFLHFSANILNIHELSYESPIFKFLAHRFCTISLVKDLCVREIFQITGYNNQQFNYSLLPIISANFPAGSSIKQLKHFAQEIKTGGFHQYDYGFLKNEIKYGRFYPPNYNLKNVKAPIHLLYSVNDYLSSPVDVKKLFSELPDGDKNIWKVENKKWNHIDYLWGIDAKKYVYDVVLKSMETYLDDKKI